MRCLTCDTKIHCSVGTLHCATFEVGIPIPVCCVDDHIAAEYRAHFVVQKSHIVIVTGEVTPVLILYLEHIQLLFNTENRDTCL